MGQEEKFVWQEGDIAVVKLQCGECIFNNPNTMISCIQYPERKPSGVLHNTKDCDKFREVKIDE